MLLDGRNEAEVDDNISADIIIIGAGTMGLFIAATLAKTDREIILVESGGRVADTTTNKITARSQGKQHNGVALGRASGLGGTSVLWGGQLAEFEELDLLRDDAPWPISFTELNVWYEHVYRQLGVNCRMSVSEWRRKFGNENQASDCIERFFTLWMEQPNFAKLFQNEIISNPRIRIILNSTVNSISFTGARADVVHAVSGGRQLRIKGNDFVFATGTIATSRFFLSTRWRSSVPWRCNDCIGRYFQDHLGGKIADVEVLNEKRFREFFENAFVAGEKLQPKLRLTEAARKELPTGICGLFSFDSEISESVSNIKALARALRSGTAFSGSKTLPRDFVGLARAFGPLILRYLRDHRVFAFFDKALEYHVQAEQIPISRSRITLLEDVVADDGLPCAVVDWQVDGREIETTTRFAEMTNFYLQALGVARLHLAPEIMSGKPEGLARLTDTYHPCGGMRMSSERSAGVVDPACRVWDTENVYVSGASVFPSSSHANCTLTALALAARLAARLAQSR